MINLATVVRLPIGNHTPLLLVSPQAANRTIGQGGFQEVVQMALFTLCGVSGGSARCLARGGQRSTAYPPATPPTKRSVHRSTCRGTTSPE